MTIEGIPDGWEPVRFDYVNDGESYLGGNGEILIHLSPRPTNAKRLIVRKKPKQYRPFANAAEFEPHRDRWIEYTSPNHGDCSFYRVTSFHNERVWLGPDNSGRTFREAFHCLKFDDGSPFGIEVTE